MVKLYFVTKGTCGICNLTEPALNTVMADFPNVEYILVDAEDTANDEWRASHQSTATPHIIIEITEGEIYSEFIGGAALDAVGAEGIVLKAALEDAINTFPPGPNTEETDSNPNNKLFMWAIGLGVAYWAFK